jgi:hypothetical protein
MVKVIVAFIMGFTLSACVADKLFPYFYYSLDANSYEGQMRGPKPADDIPLQSCYPTDGNKAPCVVMFTSAFLRLKEDHIKCQLDLDAAQRQCQ